MQTIPANELLAGLTLAEPADIHAVVTDSRKVEPGCVFVCFPGERVDGHTFAAGAYRNGAAYIIANHPVDGVPEDRTVIVPDSARAMIRMASNYRMLFSPKMIGVTGSVGKTTTIGKIAKQLCDEGKKVLLVAGDTFRAAAADQLEIWAERSGADIVRQHEGADPASVVYDGIQSAKTKGVDVIIIDTAGRLHNKTNLMNELNKISRIVERELPNASREVLLVLDGTTGQNGLIQAKQFKEIAGVTALAITKLDGTAKGGIVIAVADTLGLPVKFIGVGEKAEDLMRFQAKDFVDALFE